MKPSQLRIGRLRRGPLTAVLAAVAFGLPALAQEGVLTLKRAVAIAEEHNRQLKAAEEELEEDETPQPAAASLPPEWQEALKEFGERLPDLWREGLFTQPQRKALLRCLIDKVVIHRVGRDQVHTRIVWKGGDTTTCDVPITVGSFAELSFAEDMEASGYDARLEAGMTVCVESYMGEVGGAEGVKLEQQVLITETGTELLSTFPFEDALMPRQI